MGWLQDLLQEVPLSAVLKERVALAEQKYVVAIKENENLKLQLLALQEENAALRDQIPKLEPAAAKRSEFADDTLRLLVHLFRAEGDARDVGAMAKALQMEKGVVKYHLDRLDDAGLATCTGGNYLHGHIYWSLTPEGRRYTVEHNLL